MEHANIRMAFSITTSQIFTIRLYDATNATVFLLSNMNSIFLVYGASDIHIGLLLWSQFNMGFLMEAKRSSK